MSTGLHRRDVRERSGSGPGWPVRSPSSAWAPGSRNAGASLRALWSRGAVSWYVGGGIALLWLVSTAQDVVAESPTFVQAGWGVTLVVVFALAFLAAAPLAWTLPGGWRLLVCAALFALSFALFPWIGWDIAGMWTYVGVIVGLCVFRWDLTWPILVGLGVLALVTAGIGRGWSEDILWLPAIIVSVSMMMAAFARTTAAMNELRATQSRLEELAVERERGRVSRDLHDILGHSLTVITVKSELAGRLVDADPARARAEIADVESLARGALADVRATVAGNRGLTLASELAAARVALSAAAIAADLPSSADAIVADRSELAGWVVREGVTNVVRHSAASVCRITFDAHEVQVDDDGVGTEEEGVRVGNGLDGLRERVEAAGGRMSVGRSDLGGFRLRVKL